jgi:hypothetical protein
MGATGSTLEARRNAKSSNARPPEPARDFATAGQGAVQGLKVHDGTLWAASNARVFHFARSGKLIGKYTGGRLFNDLAINSARRRLHHRYKSRHGRWDQPLNRSAPTAKPALKIEAANGIALSTDGNKL